MQKLSSQYDAKVIDEIVRTVVQRLMANSRNEEKQSDPSASEKPPTLKHPSNGKSTVLKLDEKIVALDVLRNRLSGIRRLVVKPATIITPAAKDELRDRKVEVEYCEAGDKSSDAEDRSASSKPSLVVIRGRGCQSMADCLTELDVCGSPTTIDTIREAMNPIGNQLNGCVEGIVICDQPHELIWQIHNLGGRAALYRGAHELDELCEGFQPAWLVLDGRCGLDHGLVVG